MITRAIVAGCTLCVVGARVVIFASSAVIATISLANWLRTAGVIMAVSTSTVLGLHSFVAMFVLLGLARAPHLVGVAVDITAFLSFFLDCICIALDPRVAQSARHEEEEHGRGNVVQH